LVESKKVHKYYKPKPANYQSGFLFVLKVVKLVRGFCPAGHPGDFDEHQLLRLKI